MSIQKQQSVTIGVVVEAPAIVLALPPDESVSQPLVVFKINKKRRRSSSVDGGMMTMKRQLFSPYTQQLSLSCTVLNSQLLLEQQQNKVKIKQVSSAAATASASNNRTQPSASSLGVPGGSFFLKLPGNSSSQTNSSSKLSLNALHTPAGSCYDVSDTNSMIYNKQHDFDDEDDGGRGGVADSGADQSLFPQFSKLKLTHLDEQVATNYKLKCKNWLKNLINTPT